MKIQIFDYTETDANVQLTIRVEQEECNYQNSVSNKYTFEKTQYPYLQTEDDFKTLAFRSLRTIFERVFKQTGYVEETLNPIGFTIIQPKVQLLEIHAPENLIKYIGEELNVELIAVVFNHFGEVIENIMPQYNTNEISDLMTELKVTASYEDLFEELIIPVKVEERPASDIQMLGKMVSDLMIDNAEKDETISIMGCQITDLILG